LERTIEDSNGTHDCLLERTTETRWMKPAASCLLISVSVDTICTIPLAHIAYRKYYMLSEFKRGIDLR
jgi:hypothetical protein